MKVCEHSDDVDCVVVMNSRDHCPLCEAENDIADKDEEIEDLKEQLEEAKSE